jgi:acyl carrier protein
LIQRLVAFYANLLGVSQSTIRQHVDAGDYSFLNPPGIDSLDAVELVMELEGLFDEPGGHKD